MLGLRQFSRFLTPIPIERLSRARNITHHPLAKLPILKKEKGLQTESKEPPCLKSIPKTFKEIVPSDGKTTVDVNNRIPEKWKSLNDLKKKEVANEFLKELDEYLKQMREHQLVVSPPTKAEKERHGKPKRPNPPFTMFYAEHYKEGKGKEPVGKETMEKYVQRWKTLPQQERDKYKEKFKLAFQEYTRKLEEWENKMIKQGKENFVERKTATVVQKPKGTRGRKKKSVKTDSLTTARSIFHGLVTVT